MIQTFEFYGQGRQIDAKGRYFRYEAGADGSGITDIALTIDGNRIGRLSPGDDIELPAEASRWEILPISNGCTGTVRVGNARLTSQKLQGVVSVINGERQRVLSSQAFIGKLYTGDRVAPAANSRSLGQMWNPAGSGRNVWVSSLSMFATTAQVGASSLDWAYIGVSRASAVLANSAMMNTQPVNKRIGGAASPVQLLGALANIAGTGTGTTAADTLAEGSIKIQTGLPVELQEPLMLPPGTGLTFWGNNVGVDVIVQFTEEPA